MARERRPASQNGNGDHGPQALREPFCKTGGLARADDLARLLEYLDRGDYISLARHLAAHDVFGFHSGGRLWIPMFQFDLRDLSLHPAAQAVLSELEPAFDGWALACWFAEPNPWLGDRRPVDMVHREHAAVCEAARADRFALLG